MRPGASLFERFDGWFVRPIEKLKELPEGDGGFLALSAALFLCERYYRTLTNTQENPSDDKSFKVEAAKDLGIELEDFNCFWQVYRNGIQHQGMPRRFVDKKKRLTYGWNMDERFSAIPIIHEIDAKTREIRLNPWKFAELIISKFRDNPEILKNATLHAFGEVKNATPAP
jgi:hypothetical protein